MKFGGTSLGSPERLLRVVDIVCRARKKGKVVIVVSAMSNMTDRLIEAAEQSAEGDEDSAEHSIDRLVDDITSNALPVLKEIESARGRSSGSAEITRTIRELSSQARRLLYGIRLLRELTDQTRDLIMSFGEQISAMILSILIDANGIESRFVDARKWLVTDDGFGRARADIEASRRALLSIERGWEGAVPVITGFIGCTVDGRTTTLGRNGSDYTATLTAHILQADEVVVWTDVSGVMTADPAFVSDAYPLSRMSYAGAIELVDFGASMFHPSTMIPLMESGIPMRIRNTMHPKDPGTVVDVRGAGGEGSATCVTSLERLALLGVQMRRITKRAHVAGRVLKALDDAGTTLFMATQSAHGQSVAVAVPMAEVESCVEVIRSALEIEIERGETEDVVVRKPVTLLSLVTETNGRDVDVAGRFFGALGAVGVDVLAIAQGTASRSISCVIDENDTRVAVRTVHAAFNFAHQEVCLLVLGKGTVGAELLLQVRSEAGRLERESDVRLRVMGIVGSREAVFDESGIDLRDWKSRMEAVEDDQSNAPVDITGLLKKMRRLPVPILVDCTAADGMEDIYSEAFALGIHVVGANKKPLTIAWEDSRRLLNDARRHHRSFQFETTVGAALPVIDTLKDLVRTGDRVLLVEGSFSGTLGFLANEVMSGRPLSGATRSAFDAGFTEPNPKEDLSGMDVARKALILARELGMRIDLEGVAVEPFVPKRLLDGVTSPADLFDVLAGYDDEMEAEMARLRNDGKLLRYMARIDMNPAPDHAGPAVTVGPVTVSTDHPSSLLSGTESFVAFTTERYRETPLIIQGAGAGGSVTAAGVLADVLKISMMLRGH